MRALERELAPAVTVNTGDFSGLGGIFERGLIRALGRLRNPHVFAPGNHDGADTSAAMVRAGAFVLDQPRVVQVAGLRIWGYADPNRTRFGRGDSYRSDLCETKAATVAIPIDQGPVVSAVHNERMMPAGLRVPLLLCGHVHEPYVHRAGPTLVIRCGSTGGGGPFGGALHFAIIDVNPQTHAPVSVWMGSASRSGLEVTEVPCGG